MKIYILLTGLITLASCGGGNNPVKEAEKTNDVKIDSTSVTASQSAQSKRDADFIIFAANVGTFEIQVAKLADNNSINKSVEEFAAMMIKDHTDLGNKVSALATQKGVTLPSALSTDLQNEYNKLDSLKGKKFDEEYIDANVKGHTEAVAKFESVANDSTYSADVKQFVSSALPVLMEHKQHAEALQQSEKGNKKSAS